MAKVLVLGGTMFFGKRLVEQLLNHGHKVTIATRGLTKDPFGDRVERLKIDRIDRESLDQAFVNKSWDIVFDQSCFSAKEALDSTEALTGKVRKYIFTSSQAVYDFGIQCKEKDFNPLLYKYELKTRQEYKGYIGYQEAKRAAEAILFQNSNFEVVSVRLPIVVGEDDYTDRLKFHVWNIMHNRPIGITDPKARYSFIQSKEAANFLLEIGFSSFSGQINPGCSEDLSIYELCEKIARRVKKEWTITQEVTPDNQSPYSFPGSWSVNTQLAEEMGFTFSSIDSTLNQLIDYYRNEL
ncbi:NAD-dependent epimerase/dehydratase family protein [Halalkalibacter akibai]|uniref:Isoflavone reductase n=1 Tax=Halalkalibacter akibai (strain ATCC 43226 / DSM 21942 / CIP 109018 / JCM 9157 / 1139) TaxID=1236973 RepID=W4QZ73_HALA3|nr:NAD-dependent epimerase/dehydratase family protein [Halalkalibacter akibai]GAE36958.1 isoflavone reductase [Halalkalibacter akibai JCM 9157]